MNHKITIITPTLNQGAYIEDCILSVLNQNYDNLDFIVIDGGSADETLSILKKYEKHFSYCISESDRGQSDAINKGLKLASGDIINWLNSDDYLEPGSLNRINEAFENPSVNVFSGRSNIVKDGQILRQTRGLDVYLNNLPKTIGLARIDQPETFWRREVINKIGPLNTNLRYIMDRDWWVKYLFQYGLDGVENSEDVLVNFRLHDQSKTVSESNSFNDERNAYFSNIAAVYGFNEIGELIANNKNNLNFEISKEVDPELIKISLNYFLFQLATEYYAQSDWKNFKRLYNNLDRDLLSTEDKTYLNKLKSRSSIMPSSVHQFLNKLK